MGLGGAIALSKGLEHLACLLKPSLAENVLGDDCMMVIAQSLHSVSKLKCLDVTCNEICIQGAKGLLQHLENVPNLIELNFSFNTLYWTSAKETTLYLKQEPNLI